MFKWLTEKGRKEIFKKRLDSILAECNQIKNNTTDQDKIDLADSIIKGVNDELDRVFNDSTESNSETKIENNEAVINNDEEKVTDKVDAVEDQDESDIINEVIGELDTIIDDCDEVLSELGIENNEVDFAGDQDEKDFVNAVVNEALSELGLENNEVVNNTEKESIKQIKELSKYKTY